MDSAPFHVAEDTAKHLATIRLTRGDIGNKLLTHEIRTLGQTIRALGSRPEFKAVIVAADGEQFCLGRQPDAGGKAPTTALGVRAGVAEPILDLYADVRATPVPVIAVVQGEAKGFGCALVGQCDLCHRGGCTAQIPDAGNGQQSAAHAGHVGGFREDSRTKTSAAHGLYALRDQRGGSARLRLGRAKSRPTRISMRRWKRRSPACSTAETLGPVRDQGIHAQRRAFGCCGGGAAWRQHPFGGAVFAGMSFNESASPALAKPPMMLQGKKESP